MSIEQPSMYWDAQAATFDDQPDHGLRDPAVREAWRTLLRSVFPEPPAEVADLGCGTGSLSLLLASEGYRVTGIDLSAEMISTAASKAAASSVPVTFRRGDASDPDLGRGTLDAIVVRHVTWVLPDPSDAIRRWASLLRDGGPLVLIEGFWSTGAGIRAHDLEGAVRPILGQCEVRQLADEPLWGRSVDDERYMLVARP
ncbi:MAG: class I SAM-dependent methyltransferase [Ilumatobacter sp.]